MKNALILSVLLIVASGAALADSTATVLAGCTTAANGVISCTLQKQTLNDDGSLKSEGDHRITLSPDEDAATVLAQNSAAIQTMGFPAISDADVSAIEAMASTAWTPDVVSAYRAANP